MKNIIALTLLSMIAFAGNSLLCRLAFKKTPIDAASFTSIRLIAGAIVLGLVSWFFSRKTASENESAAEKSSAISKSSRDRGTWISAIALFVYAACFSFAYLSLTVATGALLLFGAVQTTMIGHGIVRGERLRVQQLVGLALAIGGLVYLLLPNLSAPPLVGSALMLSAGVAWGIYSLRGKGATNPTGVTAGNFLRTVPLTILLIGSMKILSPEQINPDQVGMLYAIASGAITSGLGYAVWYSVLPALKATTAATIQLSVPAITTLGGILFLNEELTLRFALTSVAILAGIALVILKKTNG